MKIFVIDKFKAIGIIFIIISISIFLFSCLGGFAKENILPIYSVETKEAAVSITFDCAWTAEDLPSIEKTLEEYNCPATFFVVGSWAEKYPDAVLSLFKKGHEVAGHSYNHAHYNSLSAEALTADMQKCDAVIKDITGSNTKIFRAPYGEYNENVVRTATSSGRTLIQWDLDSLDWKDLTESEMEARILPNVKNGSIILFHNGTKNTASALPAILKALKDKGYSFKTVSDLMYHDNYYIDHAGRQFKN
ncbi:MAG: polysaccharide deacetylase family protein [Bacillota bacterium]|nr:polysaccharide deacetylase family protein [Bacillota bacterium]